MSAHISEFGSPSLSETIKKLPAETQSLIPKGMTEYYSTKNELHCGPGEGGSKFTDPKVENIFDVLLKTPDLSKNVSARTDDRDAFRALGVPDSAFLPATRTEDHPADLPEALYYKVDNIEGRLGVVQIKELPSDARILVRRENGSSNPDDKKTYTPVSFTYINGTVYDMPRTNFATVIVGRDVGEENCIWTIHPGAPVRPVLKEMGDLTKALVSPEEVSEGEKQPVRVITVGQLLKEGALSADDYIKIVPGKLDSTLQKYQVVE